MKQKRNFKEVVLVLDHLVGSLRYVERGKGSALVGIDLASGTEEALETFRAAGLRIIVLLPGSGSKKDLQLIKDLLVHVDEVLAIGPRLREAPERVALKDRKGAEKTLFVASDRVLRGTAVQLGFEAAPGPSIASLMVQNRRLFFFQAWGERESLRGLPDLVPYHRDDASEGPSSVLGVGSRKTLEAMVKARMGFEVLPLDLATEDPLWIQLDPTGLAGWTGELRATLLLADGPNTLVGIGWDQTTESLAVKGAHGHFHLLVPSPDLLAPPKPPDDAFRSARIALGLWPIEEYKLKRLTYDILNERVLRLFCPINGTAIQGDVDRYSGVSALDSSGTVASRHIQHPGNGRVVQALLDDLRAIGYCAYTHSFTHNGDVLENVIADLPGSGYFRLAPWILEELRRIFVRYPNPFPPDPWVRAVKKLVGPKWFEELHLSEIDPCRLRRELERIFELRPYWPWWRKACLIRGWGAQIVIVGAHFDSTAGYSSGYDPSTDPAPGADDNASGIATTLALARFMWNYRRKLPHTVRFCFFNAEEQGLVGSKAYAAAMKAAGAPIRAVVCADMLGYNSDANRIFEVHAGYTDAAVRDLSVPIADTIAAWSLSFGALAPAQVYKGTSVYGGVDRDLYDGAINRSDHAAFHQQGYGAVVVSEDFFGNLSTEPGADPNPNYHTTADTVIDSAYTADIACAMAFAVKELAGG